jgi:NADH/NAD ratio-sensing transcriptional regulator Rex
MSDLTIRSKFAKTLTLLALVSVCVGVLILTAVHGQNSTDYSSKFRSTRATTTSSWLLTATNYEGFVDAMDCGVIRGWAADLNRPNISINVRIYDGNTLVTTIPANLFRQDVADHLHDNGVHGFNIPTPVSLQTGPHTVSVKFESSSTNLIHSPKTLDCPLYVGFADLMNCDVIIGWAANRNRPNTVINVSIYDGSTLVTTVPANLFRQGVADYLQDNGLHGFNIPTPASLKTGPHIVSVKFESSITNLAYSPQTIACPLYEGSVDTRNCGVIAGWAADHSRLNTSINVSIYDGSTLVTTIAANQLRPDVGRHLNDNGLHGFNIRTPPGMQTGQHIVSVKFESSATNLSQSPKAIDCGFLPKYLVGAYYFAGWWRCPEPAHYLNGYPSQPVDWRPDFREREPVIGWYDDRQDLVDREIAIAAAGGLDFFVFDYYKAAPDPRPHPGANANLNNGLTFFLTSPKKGLMHFAITYPNDGDYAILTKPEWRTYASKWVELFQDPQYLKIDGRPVFFINGAEKMSLQWDNVQEVLQILRDKAVIAGFPGVLIGGGLPIPSAGVIHDLTDNGYDFFTAYGGGFSRLKVGANEYKDVLSLMTDTWDTFLASSKIPYAPVVIQGWDKRPVVPAVIPPDWVGDRYFINKTPEIFGEQLRLARDFLDNNPSMRIKSTAGGQRMLVIYAWNEIGEGGELIPTLTEGDVYLNQLRTVFH